MWRPVENKALFLEHHVQNIYYTLNHSAKNSSLMMDDGEFI